MSSTGSLRFRVGRTELSLEPRDEPSTPVPVVIREEDTFLVLSADPEVRESKVHPIRLMTGLMQLEARQPGEVVRSGRGPTQLLAVVHDLSLDETTRPEWILRALDRALDEVEALGVDTFGVEVLGAVHGRADPRICLSRLVMRLAAERPRAARVVVIGRPQALSALARVLDELSAESVEP
ncbi:MAG: hypothetical protein HYV07_03865 [Deltaproteobacteria bacterium]|nr:hypothetical protein [Deltaproteobacteria bacterium]